MADPNGWPYPERPGVPMNPEVDGWHWIEPKFGPKAMWPAYWCASNGGYWNWQSDDASDRQDYAAHMRDGSWKYRGPCLLPAEVAARVEEARAKALEDAAALASNAEADTKEVSENPAYDADTRRTFYTMGRACKEIAVAIRALKENTT